MKNLAFIAAILLTLSACKKKRSMSSLTDAYCDCLEQTKKLSASDRMDSCDFKVLSDTLNAIENDSLANYLFDDLNVSLQKDCAEYRALLDSSEKSIVKDWTETDFAKAVPANSSVCEEIKGLHQFYYIEPTKDTTYVSISGNTWVETIKGKYQSRLSFTWTSECMFELSFISSTDPAKKKMSKPGEKYLYKVVEQSEGYFVIAGSVKKKGIQFRLFYQ